MMHDKNKIYHVLPENDARPHIDHCFFSMHQMPFCQCDCKPENLVVKGGIIIVHNAFDGRLGVEWANEILKSDIK